MMPPVVECVFRIVCCDRTREFTTTEDAERFAAEHHSRYHR